MAPVTQARMHTNWKSLMTGALKEGRDPNEIEHTADAKKDTTNEELDALVQAGANQLIIGLGAPWDFAAVEKLVRWRDSHK